MFLCNVLAEIIAKKLVYTTYTVHTKCLSVEISQKRERQCVDKLSGSALLWSYVFPVLPSSGWWIAPNGRCRCIYKPSSSWERAKSLCKLSRPLLIKETTFLEARILYTSHWSVVFYLHSTGQTSSHDHMWLERKLVNNFF